MAKSKSYIITTLSDNLNQQNKPVFTEATPARLRLAYAPYTVVKSRKGSLEDDEDTIKFPFGAYEPVYDESGDFIGIRKVNRD